MSYTDYAHWNCKTDANNVLWAFIDRNGESTNSISPEVLEELSAIIDTADNHNALVIASGKTSGFIFGADIDLIATYNSEQQARTFIQQGQDVFNKLAALPMPTLALIRGYCLGGGLELALACRYRIAVDTPSTRLGLPEVLLGIHPGWGGTVRLPKLIGAINGLDLMLSGRMISANAAAKLGVVDSAVPLRQYHSAVDYYLHKLPRSHRLNPLWSLANYIGIRKIIAWRVRAKLAQKNISREHYPAPFTMVDNWEKYGVESAEAMAHEVDSICSMLSGPTATNLIRVYQLREQLKKIAKESTFKANKVHVIGAGVMGGDIAAWCALKGCSVTLQDKEVKSLAQAVKRAYKLFSKKLKKPRLIQEAMDRLIPDPKGIGLTTADVIIEAIFEDLTAKQELFAHVEKHARADAILATNTSTFPLDTISANLQEPQRLLGLHFFNPVAQMQLVEIIKTDNTPIEIMQAGAAFINQIGRLPLPVASSPGFLVNRLLVPYLMESVALIEEGIASHVIDDAARDFGMPLGPIELADLIGIDICVNAAQSLSNFYPVTVPECLVNMVNKGHLGKKSGRGFYNYKNGKLVKQNTPSRYQPSTDIAKRLILRLINEAVAALREKVVTKEELLDAGMIFGAGFAPHLGGPMHYVKTSGAKELHQQLAMLADRYGERFSPDPGWDSIISL